MNKPIIGVYSWRKEAVPERVLKVAVMPMVRWERSSIVQAVNTILFEPISAPPLCPTSSHKTDSRQLELGIFMGKKNTSGKRP